MVQHISRSHLHGSTLTIVQASLASLCCRIILLVLYPVSPNLPPDDDSPLPHDGSFSFHFIIYRPANTNPSTPKKAKGHVLTVTIERLELRVRVKQRCICHVTTPTLIGAFGLVFSPVFSRRRALSCHQLVVLTATPFCEVDAEQLYPTADYRLHLPRTTSNVLDNFSILSSHFVRSVSASLTMRDDCGGFYIGHVLSHEYIQWNTMTAALG